MSKSRNTLTDSLDAEGHKAYEVSTEHLFELVDKDGNGNLSREEFNKLHQVIVDSTLAEVRAKQEAERSKHVATRRARMASCMVAVMSVFLALSLVGNLFIVFSVVDTQVTTSTNANGTMTSKITATEVQVAQSAKEVMLGLLPYLPRNAPKEAMAVMPELVVVLDANHPSGNPRFHALKVEKVEYQSPATIWLYGAMGESVELEGASHGTYQRADGSKFAFCSTCAPVLLKSLVNSAAVDAAISEFEADLSTSTSLDLCASEPQTASKVDSMGITSPFMVMPAVCKAATIKNDRRRLGIREQDRWSEC